MQFLPVLNAQQQNFYYSYSKGYFQCINQDFTALGKTSAELEHNCAKEDYQRMLRELEKISKQYLAQIQKKISLEKREDAQKTLNERKKTFIKNHKDFLLFLPKYSNELASLHGTCRAYPYHFYGIMIDLIYLRIQHILEILRSF